jgi:hypothetical protein
MRYFPMLAGKTTEICSEVKLILFVDNNQTVEGSLRHKIGAGSHLTESPAPILVPIPRTPPRSGAVISAIDYGVQWARKNYLLELLLLATELAQHATVHLQ